jgi:L-lactate dehydrogenase complex protein LldG
MNSRDRILAHLRAAQANALPPPTAWEPPLRLPPGARLASLESQLSAAHAEVVHADPGGWRATLAEVCRSHAVASLLLPDRPEWLQPWPDGPQLQTFSQPIEECKEALFDRFDAGLTVARCAIADTGTLVVLSSPQQPRTLSLVPPIHLCLLDRNRLHPHLPAALAAERWQNEMPTNLLFISGPSKTADIQQTLAYGAHGPKALIVILTDGDPA